MNLFKDFLDPLINNAEALNLPKEIILAIDAQTKATLDEMMSPMLGGVQLPLLEINGVKYDHLSYGGYSFFIFVTSDLATHAPTQN